MLPFGTTPKGVVTVSSFVLPGSIWANAQVGLHLTKPAQT